MSCLVRLSNIYYNLHYILLILGICFFQSTSKVPYIKTLNKQSSCTKFRGQNGQQQVRPLRSASLQTQSSKTNDIALASFDLRWTSRIAKKNRLLPAPSSRGAKWFRYRVSIHHPLGFNWHEGPGIASQIQILLHLILAKFFLVNDNEILLVYACILHTRVIFV